MSEQPSKRSLLEIKRILEERNKNLIGPDYVFPYTDEELRELEANGFEGVEGMNKLLRMVHERDELQRLDQARKQEKGN